MTTASTRDPTTTLSRGSDGEGLDEISCPNSPAPGSTTSSVTSPAAVGGNGQTRSSSQANSPNKRLCLTSQSPPTRYRRLGNDSAHEVGREGSEMDGCRSAFYTRCGKSPGPDPGSAPLLPHLSPASRTRVCQTPFARARDPSPLSNGQISCFVAV